MPDGSKPVDMKNKSLRVMTVLFVCSLALFLLACERKVAGTKNGAQHGIMLWPAADDHRPIEDNWDKIQGVLKNYPKLYYIEEYNQGKPVGTAGKFCDLWVRDNLDAIRQKAKTPPGFTHHTVQMGLGLSDAQSDLDCFDPEHCGGKKSSRVLMPQAHYRQYINDSAEMIKAINCVLHPEECK